MKCFFCIALLLAGGYTLSEATDGIAVSSHWVNECVLYSGDGDIMRYDIRNDAVVNKRVLHAGCSRFATFNKKGTHVAFYKAAKNASGAYEWSLMTMTIEGTDLKTVMKMAGSGGRIAWTIDNWIYYFRDKDLYRVKPDNPASNEKIVTFNDNTGWWAMDAHGRRMSMGVERSHVRYTLPGNGQLDPATTSPDYVGYGCNNLISPSGMLFTWTVDAGHAGMLHRTWDSRQNYDGAIAWEDYNSWAIDKSMTMTCTGFAQPVTVGVGFEGNRWSANSDKWVCLGLGFPPDGRFAKCGKNQVLVNREDKKTIMVSFNPRASCKSSPDMCNQHLTTPREYNEAGDFFVTAPQMEIIPDLRTGSVGVDAGRPGRAVRPGRQAAEGGAAALFDIRGRRTTHSRFEKERGRESVLIEYGPRERNFRVLPRFER